MLGNPSALLLLFGLFCQLCLAYKPVVLIHGILAEKGCMDVVGKRIKEVHPGTIVYATDRFIGWSSLAPMWHQVDALAADLMNITKAHPEGIHLIGYSQGGLVSRAILEKYPDHNVQTFISLSSPQAGQYGTKFLHLYFPNLWLKTAYEIFYSDVGQYTSVANYWNDPHHQKLYYDYSVFLPFTNNEKSSNQSDVYRQGFQKIKKLVLIGGPDDEVITPWQSSHFGYYNENETVVDMKDQDFYQKDMFGLKTIDTSGRLHVITQPGIDHFSWHVNLTVIDTHIIPFLD
ncbi:lysosomal thioesterase PPT2 homolog [Neocloeon triangulifer]|uniref:lysosomal thioesterase PPT2 homolog n=1 Tax=Neocloeon triangulifer TaxID=2078957 RepID=UPI00286F33D7|nr:lysosomal thioesterase PPT2 homolog [Neocloeon triangulifer]